MRSALALAAALLLLASPVALAHAHERNVDFFWQLVGARDPATPATMPDGRSVPLAQAIDEAAARAGSVDLAAIASASVEPLSRPILGDVWVIEAGAGACTTTILGPGSPVYTPWDPQNWIYRGDTAIMNTTHGDYTHIIGWMSKESLLGSDTSGFTAIGNTDHYCIAFDDAHFAFPFTNGEAHLNDDGSLR